MRAAGYAPADFFSVGTHDKRGRILAGYSIAKVYTLYTYRYILGSGGGWLNLCKYLLLRHSIVLTNIDTCIYSVTHAHTLVYSWHIGIYTLSVIVEYVKQRQSLMHALRRPRHDVWVNLLKGRIHWKNFLASFSITVYIHTYYSLLHCPTNDFIRRELNSTNICECISNLVFLCVHSLFANINITNLS